MDPEERREALIDATVPLLYEHGRGVTTRQIAEAAGVAEGTIFRAFETKEALVEHAIGKAFSAEGVSERIREIDPSRPLRDKLLALAAIYQQRFLATFSLMRACGLVAPPPDIKTDPVRLEALEVLRESTIDLFAADVDDLAVRVDELLHLLRLLTFSGSHVEIAHGRLLTPEQIVDVILDGVRQRKS